MASVAPIVSPENAVRQDARRFFDRLAPAEQAYRFLSIRYFCIETPGSWQLIAGAIRLEAFPDSPSDDWSFRSGRIAAGRIRYRHSIDKSKALIDKLLQTGRLSVHGISMRLLNEDPTGRYGTYFQPTVAYPLPQGMNAPLLRIMGRRESWPFDIQQLDIELKAAEQPFQTVAELLNEAGLQTQFREQPTIDLSASIAAEFIMSDAESRIDGNIACVSILIADSLDIGNVRLGWRCLQGTTVQQRNSVSGRDIGWSKEKRRLRGTFKFTVPPLSVVQYFLSVGGSLQQEWWIADAAIIYNSRRAAHEAFDPKLTWLTRLLFDPAYQRPDSRKFEEGVSYLLSMLGFRATRYDKPLDDAPDIIASTTRGDIALVECTTGAIDKEGKLGKLAGRVVAVRQRLAASNHQSTRVLPVIVTALNREQISVDLEQAQKLGIAVLTSEDLSSALPRTQYQNDPHQEIYDRAFAELNLQGQFQLTQPG